jgi:hypothetical protein
LRAAHLALSRRQKELTTRCIGDKRDSVLTVAVGHMRALFHGTKRIMLTASEYRRSCLYYFSFLKSANNEIMPAF